MGHADSQGSKQHGLPSMPTPDACGLSHSCRPSAEAPAILRMSPRACALSTPAQPTIPACCPHQYFCIPSTFVPIARPLSAPTATFCIPSGLCASLCLCSSWKVRL